MQSFKVYTYMFKGEQNENDVIRIQQVQNEVENRPIKLDFLGNMRQKFEMAVNLEEMFERKTVYHSSFVNYILYIIDYMYIEYNLYSKKKIDPFSRKRSPIKSNRYN